MVLASPSTSEGPYQDSGLNKIYQLLFCDNISLYSSQTSTRAYPWDILLADKPDTSQLKALVMDQSLEARQHILAFRRLMENGIDPEQKKLLGVVVEVGLDDGADTLAAYPDGTARYINHSGKLLVWETETPESKEIIDRLFAHSQTVVNKIGPWDQERRPFPGSGMIRLSFLVSDGLYFGEGPFEVLQKDPMAAPVIEAATSLLVYLTQQGK